VERHRDRQRRLVTMRVPRALAALLATSGAGCASPHPTSAPDAATTVDAPAIVPDAAPAWWHPGPGDSRDWDIQLAGAIDVSAARTMYDLDLWSLVPAATQLDYGDGDPVTVPAGALAGTIATLHARTPRTIVVCHLETGALELARPDARKFPGYKAGMKTCPATPAAGSIIGKAAVEAGECWLDISATGRAKLDALIAKRLDLAAQIGCDGVDTDRNDLAAYTTGFPVTVDDQRAWYRAIASLGHARTLSVGMRDANEIPGFTDMLAADFDWALIQRCGEFGDCDTARPFINAFKAVLAIDYQAPDGQGGGVDPTLACMRQGMGQVQDGLVKDLPPTKAVRVQCTP